ncbi:MAG: protein kinase [Deltaproteobacteria bacterium]|nr:protein kinase [Deltaproteobacteria bacterium]
MTDPQSSSLDATLCAKTGARRDGLRGLLIDRRYRVERELGRGGMGIVLLAEDADLRRKVAVKLGRPTSSAEDDSVEHLRQEAVALASVRSAHVAAVHAFGTHDGRPFFVMEHVEGQDLQSVIHEHYRTHREEVPIHRAVAILRQIADGLGAVHRAGIVHRDVKPANVIIEHVTGRAVLVDFGIAAHGPVDHEAGAPGTPHYMAPELHEARGASASASVQADIYALGCLAYELLTGSPPFGGSTPLELYYRHMMEAPPRPSSRRGDLAFLEPLLLRMVDKRPEARFASCAAVATALEQIGLTPSGRSTPSCAGAEAAPRVLVVDDDPVFGRLAARCAQIALADVAVSVSRESSAEAALENVQRRRPDLVVLDYRLPDMDGVDLLSHIRELKNGMHTRVLVASGDVGREARWRFGILGVSDFVDKPVDLTSLVARIAQLARDHGWLPEARDGRNAAGERTGA